MIDYTRIEKNKERYEYYSGKKTVGARYLDAKGNKKRIPHRLSTRVLGNAVDELQGSCNIAFFKYYDDYTKLLDKTLLQRMISDAIICGVSFAEWDGKRLHFRPSTRATGVLSESGDYLTDGRVEIDGNGNWRRVHGDLGISYLIPLFWRRNAEHPWGTPTIGTAARLAYNDYCRAAGLERYIGEMEAQNRTLILGIGRDMEEEDTEIIRKLGLIGITSNEMNSNPNVSTIDSKADYKESRVSTRDDLRESICDFKKSTLSLYREECGDDIIRFMRVLKAIITGENYEKVEYSNKVIFETEVDEWGKLGDAIYKINETAPGFFGSEQLRELLGIDGNETPEPVVIEEQ